MSSLLEFPRPFDEPDGFRAMMLGEALSAQKLSMNKFAANQKVTLYAVLKALSEPDSAPQLIEAIDKVITEYLDSIGELDA